MKRRQVDERDLAHALLQHTRPRRPHLGVDRTDPVWQRLRAACCNHSSIDVDEHADHVYAAVVALKDGFQSPVGGDRDVARTATPAVPGKATP